MDSNDEKFFEELSGAKSAADENYEVELVKAGGSVASKPKIIHTAKEEEVWDDREPEGQLTVDVYQTADEIVVESAIAGVRADDIDVNVTTDSISIRGTRHHEKTVKEEDYLYQECYWGRFGRSIILLKKLIPKVPT
jgi:HSP20 family molecular chaperone IbpA